MQREISKMSRCEAARRNNRSACKSSPNNRCRIACDGVRKRKDQKVHGKRDKRGLSEELVGIEQHLTERTRRLNLSTDRPLVKP